MLIQAETAYAVDVDRTEITRSTSTNSEETPCKLPSSSRIFRLSVIHLRAGKRLSAPRTDLCRHFLYVLPP